MTKGPIHYKEQVNALLERLIQVGLIPEIIDDDEDGMFFINRIAYLRTGKELKLCVDPGFLNSITKLGSITSAFEPFYPFDENMRDIFRRIV